MFNMQTYILPNIYNYHASYFSSVKLTGRVTMTANTCHRFGTQRVWKHVHTNAHLRTHMHARTDTQSIRPTLHTRDH